MYCGKVPSDVGGAYRCQHVPWQSERGAPHPHCFLGAAGLLCVLPEVWLTAGSSLQREMCLCVPFFVLSLLLGECVTEPVQLAKQAKPHLAAVVCCCVNWLWKAPARAAAGTKEREGERSGSTSLVGVSSYPCSCVKLKSVEETLLYKKIQNSSSVLGFGQFPSLQWLCKISVPIISAEIVSKVVNIH